MYLISATTFMIVLLPLAESPIRTVRGLMSSIRTSRSGPKFWIWMDSFILLLYIIRIGHHGLAAGKDRPAAKSENDHSGAGDCTIQ